MAVQFSKFKGVLLFIKRIFYKNLPFIVTLIGIYIFFEEDTFFLLLAILAITTGIFIIGFLLKVWFQSYRIEFKDQSLYVYFPFRVKRFNINSLKVNKVISPYGGYRKNTRLIFEDVSTGKNFVVYNDWEDYKGLLNYLHKNKYLDEQVEDIKINEYRRLINKSVIVFIIAGILLTILLHIWFGKEAFSDGLWFLKITLAMLLSGIIFMIWQIRKSPYLRKDLGKDKFGKLFRNSE